MAEEAKRELNRFDYDYQNSAVARDGITYPFGGLPESAKLHLQLIGLSLWLSRQDDPRGAYEAVKSGAKAIRRDKAPASLDPWREAAAIVQAERAVKAAGIKPPSGKKLRDLPEFQSELARAREAAKGWDKAQVAQAKAHPDVVREHRALTGKADDLDSLFAAPAPAALDEAA